MDFYFNNVRKYRVKDTRYQAGRVRFGYGCRAFEIKKLSVKGGRPTPSGCKSNYRYLPKYSECKASSIWANNRMGVSHGRGLLNSPQGWSARYNRKGQWWQMDAGAIRPIVGIETQRRRNSGQRVTGYKVMTSRDGRTWAFVDGGKVFSGNENNEAKVLQRFSSAVMARYVRLVVQTWSQHISMRAALRLGRMPCTGTLLSAGMPVRQSSEGWGGRPRRAVDGNTDGRYSKKSCSHTKNAGSLFLWCSPPVAQPAASQAQNRTDPASPSPASYTNNPRLDVFFFRGGGGGGLGQFTNWECLVCTNQLRRRYSDLKP